MPFIKTEIPGLLIFDPVVYSDDRGYFYESYNERTFQQEEVAVRFVQDNQARSVYGVVRGMHFQNNPHAQTKLVRVLDGVILDVVVDLRIGSPSFGKAFAIELSAANNKQLLIPKGFAHGYSVLSKTAEVFYKCDEFYYKECERGLAFNDPALNIDWRLPVSDIILSSKDSLNPSLDKCDYNFIYEG